MPTLIVMRSFLQQFAYLLPDIIGRETKVRVHIGELARGTEAIDADHPPSGSDITPPTLSGAGLDRHAARHGARQHRLAVGRVLGLERLGRRHGDEAYAP